MDLFEHKAPHLMDYIWLISDSHHFSHLKAIRCGRYKKCTVGAKTPHLVGALEHVLFFIIFPIILGMSSSQLTIRHIFQRGRAILDKENMRLWHGMTQAWRNWKSAKSHGNPMEIPWKSGNPMNIWKSQHLQSQGIPCNAQ